MANNEANIKAVITADDKASGVLKNFGDNVGSAASKIGSVLKTAAEGLAIGAAAATAFGVHALKAFDEAEKGIAQTNAVLASTKGIAGVTADQVDRLSKSLQKATTFSDEEVRSAENLLLTFTSIGKDIFPQATKTVLNMATALGEDTKSASIQLGKALQDPILGVTALRRVGVNFNDAQKDVIKNLVETGHSAEAQRLILKELETEFGNSAEAARHTFGGSLKALQNQLNDVEESVGGAIKNALQPFIQKAADFAASINWEVVINRSVDALKRLWRELEVVYGKLRAVYDQVANYLAPKLEALGRSVEEKLFPTLLRLWHEIIEPLIPVIGTIFVAAIGAVIDIINLLVAVIVPLTNFLLNHKTAVIAAATAFGVLAGAMALNAAFSSLTLLFNTFMLITIPSMQASLAALSASFVAAMPVVAVAAAAAAIVASIMTIKRAWEDVNNAQRAANNLGNDDQVRQLQKQAAAARAIGDTAAVNKYANAIAALSGGRADGGPVMAGKSYLVGERGPEIITPSQSGNVIPNNKLGGLGGNVTIQINAGALMGSDVEARKFANIIVGHIKDLATSKSMSVNQVLGM